MFNSVLTLLQLSQCHSPLTHRLPVNPTAAESIFQVCNRLTSRFFNERKQALKWCLYIGENGSLPASVRRHRSAPWLQLSKIRLGLPEKVRIKKITNNGNIDRDYSENEINPNI